MVASGDLTVRNRRGEPYSFHAASGERDPPLTSQKQYRGGLWPAVPVLPQWHRTITGHGVPGMGHQWRKDAVTAKREP
jgi:hypothetical protein